MNGGRDRRARTNPAGGRDAGEAALKAIPSPYNWVPLAKHVFEPDWGARVTHDIPFADGLCGRITFTLVAHTPILVCGEQPEVENGPADKTFFRLPDGRFTIPGSTLRGCIRAVLEIAAFGAMRFVDDRRFGVRDLTDAAKPFYRDFLQDVRAGFLSIDARTGTWRLQPCAWAQIPFAELERKLGEIGKRSDWLCRRSTARQRYEHWKRAGLGLDWTVRVQPAKNRTLARFAGGDGINARLVFTGNTGVSNPQKRKKHEFIFHTREADRIDVPPAVRDAFFAVHEASEDWAWWLGRLRRGEVSEVPVFWIADSQGQPWRIGLARMFRLAWENSIHDCIRRTSPRHLEPDVLDLPALLFGRAGDPERGVHGLAGRVVFDHAPAEEKPEPMKPVRTVPGAPKPSFYPNYVVQPTEPHDPGRLAGDTYATYTPLADAGREELRKPRIRGWKRYPVRPADQVHVPEPPERSSPKAQVHLHPLPAGTRFRGGLRFHNLRPAELGAVVWALTWGGDANLRHALGMGRPYGWGQVSVGIGEVVIEPNDPAAGAPSLDACLQAFEELMEDWCRRTLGHGWRESEPMVQLLAMADPQKAVEPKKGFPGELRYPQLPDFRKIKNRHLVLAPYWWEPPKPRRVRHLPSGRVACSATPWRDGRFLLRFEDGSSLVARAEEIEDA